jgi:hypothetical protein
VITKTSRPDVQYRDQDERRDHDVGHVAGQPSEGGPEPEKNCSEGKHQDWKQKSRKKTLGKKRKKSDETTPIETHAATARTGFP